MYKKLIDLKKQLQADKKQLETEVKKLQAIIDKPGLKPFDEFVAASRITAAKSKDHLEGTKTAALVIKAVDQERETMAKKLTTAAKHKTTAQQKLPQKQAQLASIEGEIASLGWKIKAMVDVEAKERLLAQIKIYRQAAVELVNSLIEIDALNAITTDEPNENPAKEVLRVESLPAISLDRLESIEPWLLQASGEKFIFPREVAFSAVHNRSLAIIEEIRGTLYAK